MHETLDAAIAKAYEGQDSAGVEKRTAYGHPAQALIEASKEADLLVVGRHGHGAFTGMLLGSVSIHCVTGAFCPVVVVRGSDGETEPGPLPGARRPDPRRLLARRQLPVGRPDLPDGQPAADRAAARRAHQAAAARPLGHLPRPELHLGAPVPRHHRARHRDDDRHRARSRRARGAGQHLAGGQLLARSTRACRGTRRACTRCSGSSPSPAGCPATSRRRRPGSIHEGGELGYSLSHACGAAFDNPGLVVACVVGDGEAETGPLATSWHGCRFLDPARDGAVLPILHLNGYKIANPALLARLPDDELDALLRGYGYQPRHVTGHEPSVMHQKMAAALDECLAEIRAIQDRARNGGGETGALADDRAAHAQGLDRPDARWTGCRWRAPGGRTRCRWPRSGPTRRTCGSWRSGCAPTGRRSCSTPTGRPGPELLGLVPAGPLRLGASPARQRRRAAARPGAAGLPRLRGAGPGAGSPAVGADPGARRDAARRDAAQRRRTRTSGCSARTRPSPTGSARCSR